MNSTKNTIDGLMVFLAIFLFFAIGSIFIKDIQNNKLNQKFVNHYSQYLTNHEKVAIKYLCGEDLKCQKQHILILRGFQIKRERHGKGHHDNVYKNGIKIADIKDI